MEVTFTITAEKYDDKVKNLLLVSWSCKQVQNLQDFKGVKATQSLTGLAFICVLNVPYSFSDFTQNGFKQLTVNKD